MRNTSKFLAASLFSLALVLPAAASDRFTGSHQQREQANLSSHQYAESSRSYGYDRYGRSGRYSDPHEAQEAYALAQHQNREQGGYGWNADPYRGNRGPYGWNQPNYGYGRSPRGHNGLGITINIGRGRHR